jgi:hypothetical protein
MESEKGLERNSALPPTDNGVLPRKLKDIEGATTRKMASPPRCVSTWKTRGIILSL